MKINDVVIGKRVTVGAAFNGVAVAVSHYLPDHAPAIIAVSGTLTFVAQILLAKYGGITQ